MLICGGYDVCSRRNLRLHAVGTDPTHGHYLVSDKDFLDWELVRDKLKNLLSLFLGRATGNAGRRWFSDGASRKRVETQSHFDHLVNSYLPDQCGIFWKPGVMLPEIPDGIL
ncbi:MAG TPA: hypothetical protein VLI90_06250 [Tepidisphaeraceae bacterium]|nr:hypothetical protein [Tepidisphaeraceae bacterium]